MQVDLKMQVDEEINVPKVKDNKKIKAEQIRKQNCGNRSRVTAQDSQFINHISYLSQVHL